MLRLPRAQTLRLVKRPPRLLLRAAAEAAAMAGAAAAAVVRTVVHMAQVEGTWGLAAPRAGASQRFAGTGRRRARARMTAAVTSATDDGGSCACWCEGGRGAIDWMFFLNRQL